MRVSRTRGAGLALSLVPAATLISCATPASSGAAAELTFVQDRYGNVFTRPATPTVSVRSGAEVRWSAEDHFGRWSDEGTATPSDGVARIRVPVPAAGHYTVTVRASGATARTTLAVLPAAARPAADGITYSVQTHFGHGWDTRLVPLADAVGVEAVRDAQRWESIETAKGRYDWQAEDNRYQRYMAALRTAGIEPLIGFGRSNRHHDGGCTPHTDAGRAAMGLFAAAVIEHYGTQIQAVGVYNEPNGGGGDFGEPNGPYACDADSKPLPHRLLVDEMARAAHEARPGVKVVAPDIADGQSAQPGATAWLKDLLGHGGRLPDIEAVSLHPYRPDGKGKPHDCEPDTDCRPEGLVPDQLRPVRKYLDAHGGESIPIWIDEMGWHTDEAGGDALQAAYLPRAHVVAIAAGVPRFNWYALMDHGGKTFGMIRRADGVQGGPTTKASYVAYGVMTSQLGGLRYGSRDAAPSGVRSYAFTDGPRPVRALWTVGEDRTIRLRTPDASLRVVDPMGRERTVPASGGSVTVPISKNPLYVHGKVTQVGG